MQSGAKLEKRWRVLVGVQPCSINEAVQVLLRGEAVIFPTDTVYGVGIAVEPAESPRLMYDLKERDWGKPIAWLVASPADLDRYGAHVPDYARALAREYWPGALTLIVKASDEVPVLFQSQTGSIGLRMPRNTTALSLVRAAGSALCTTSANFSGNSDSRLLSDLDPQFIARVGTVVAEEISSAERETSGVASTVVDCTQATPLILREGSITQAHIDALLCTTTE